MSNTVDFNSLRTVLAAIQLGASHKASEPPQQRDIFAPSIHGAALDPNRALVVGNRGVGKSFWSSVLASSAARAFVAPRFPNLGLMNLDVVLGFHESAGASGGIAPSKRVLKQLIDAGDNIEVIWQAVLLRALPTESTDLQLPERWTDSVSWVALHVEECELALRKADHCYTQSGRRFLLVFDALDRLGSDWQTIRLLSQGIVRLALELRGYRSLRAKVFMRSDQASDDSLFRFADASKLRAEKVDLVWRQRDLYGLLFNLLWREPGSASSFAKLVGEIGIRASAAQTSLPTVLSDDEQSQAAAFFELAGEFMGSDRRRGRTYTWLSNHLADAFGETSPRSFLIALQRAAEHNPPPKNLAIDHNGLRVGVQEASAIRVEELREDYAWIEVALLALEGLEVPCTASTFVSRWISRKTVDAIETTHGEGLGPVEFEGVALNREEKLLLALQNIGVIERRSESRINMPDIFRVAARIKRRGGVRPPIRAGRR